MLKVGKHCDFCKQNDFLPYQCKKCQKLCCSEHREQHPCIQEKNEPIPERQQTSKPKKVYKQPIVPKQQPSTKFPEKIHALEKLKAYMASKPQRTKSKPSKVSGTDQDLKKQESSAIGDDSIPFANRYFVHIRRPQTQVKDALTGQVVIRPEKKAFVFYDKSKPIGHALDRARKTLGVSSAASFQLNGSTLPPGSPIAGIPPNSILDLV